MLSLVRFQNLSEDILSSVVYSGTIVTKNAKKARLELCSNKKNYAQLQRFLLENAFNRKLSACAVKLVLLINSTLFLDQSKMCGVGQKSAPTIFRFSAPASDSEPGARAVQIIWNDTNQTMSYEAMSTGVQRHHRQSECRVVRLTRIC